MTQFHKYDGLIITGPTACGKSSFAAKLANKISGTIINADSQQVYREIPIISASPLIEDELLKLAPHKLFGFRNGNNPLSASDYGNLANKYFNETISENRIPLFVGGTGFYLNTLTDGLSPIPEPDEISRQKARELTNYHIELAYSELQKIDPTTKINKNDKQRISRALEIYYSTNKPLSYWQKLPKQPSIKANLLKVLILPDREILRKRIKQRIEIMLDLGALNEVKAIIKLNYNKNLPIMKADGILELSKFINNEIDLQTAKEEMALKSIHYMKRQITYFSNNFKSDIIIPNIPNETDLKTILKIF